jgi:hypothetical protein
MLNVLRSRIGGSVQTSIVVLCVSAHLAAQTPATTSTSSTSTSSTAATVGTTIGTIVKSAVGAAFPGVDPILNLLFGSKAKPDTKTTQSAAKTTLTDPKSQATLKTSAQDQAKPFVAPATQIADELAVVEKFASASGQANQNLITMQTLLTVSPQPGNLLPRLKEEWGLAGDILSPLFAKDMDTQIQKIRDPAVQVMLLQIHGANTNVSGRIASRMKAAKLEDIDLPGLKDLVVALTGLLSGAQTMAAAELNILQQDLAALAVWANSKAQGDEESPIKPDQKLLDFASKQVATARAVTDRIRE